MRHRPLDPLCGRPVASSLIVQCRRFIICFEESWEVVQDAVGRTLAHTCAPNKHPGRPVVFVRQHPRYWGRMCATASLARDHAHSAPPQRGSLLLRKEGTLGSCQETCGASRPHLVVDGRGSPRQHETLSWDATRSNARLTQKLTLTLRELSVVAFPHATSRFHV